MNESFIEKLKANAENLSTFGLKTVKECIDELLNRSNEEKTYVMLVKGEKLYSFMTEEEMYQKVGYNSKDEYIQEQSKIQKINEEYEADKKVRIKEALEKLPKYKKIYEECFPKEKVQKDIKIAEDELKNGELFEFYTIESRVELLEAAKTKPLHEVKKLYYSEKLFENRLLKFDCLLDSFYADVFESIYLDDYLKEVNKNGELSQEDKDKFVLRIKNRVEKAMKSPELKGIEVKNLLKRNIDNAIKNSNNLGNLFGDEGSGKGRGSNKKGKSQ